MKSTKKLEKIVTFLNSLEGTDLVQMNNLYCTNANYFDNEIFNFDEDFFETFFFNKTMEAVRAAVFGDINWNDEFIYFNGYGNLESTSYPEYFEFTETMADYILENPEGFEGYFDELDEILND